MLTCAIGFALLTSTPASLSGTGNQIIDQVGIQSIFGALVWASGILLAALLAEVWSAFVSEVWSAFLWSADSLGPSSWARALVDESAALTARAWASALAGGSWDWQAHRLVRGWVSSSEAIHRYVCRHVCRHVCRRVCRRVCRHVCRSLRKQKRFIPPIVTDLHRSKKSKAFTSVGLSVGVRVGSGVLFGGWVGLAGDGSVVLRDGCGVGSRVGVGLRVGGDVGLGVGAAVQVLSQQLFFSSLGLLHAAPPHCGAVRARVS